MLQKTALIEVVRKGKHSGKAKATLFDQEGQMIGKTILFGSKDECIERLTELFPDFTIDTYIEPAKYVLVD